MKQSITTIIFDFGDVLVQDKTKQLEKKYVFDAMTKTEQKRYIQAFHQSEVGKLPTKQLLRVMSETLAKKMTPAQIEAYVLNSKILPPWKLLLKLKKAGYKIIIFSNNQRTWPKKFSHILKTDFQQFPFINSATVGIRKPHLGMYRYMLKKYAVKPKEAIFIDDREKNLEPAQKLGMRVFHYTQNYMGLIGYLKREGIRI